jgi:anthranilate 1,2-dioxygenase large subunit/terephthalate 1,2-dioxygenase oxygenase component alpha subunit
MLTSPDNQIGTSNRVLSWPREGVRRIPYAVYSEPEVYEQEQQRIFRGPIWHFLGLEAQVPEPGCFITVQFGNTPVIMVRDRDGDVRAMINRCSHKGTPLAIVPSGKVDQFMCIYHNWCYDLTGKMLSAAFERGVRGKGGMASTFRTASGSRRTGSSTSRTSRILTTPQFSMRSTV